MRLWVATICNFEVENIAVIFPRAFAIRVWRRSGWGPIERLAGFWTKVIYVTTESKLGYVSSMGWDCNDVQNCSTSWMKARQEKKENIKSSSRDTDFTPLFLSLSFFPSFLPSWFRSILSMLLRKNKSVFMVAPKLQGTRDNLSGRFPAETFRRHLYRISCGATRTIKRILPPEEANANCFSRREPRVMRARMRGEHPLWLSRT